MELREEFLSWLEVEQRCSPHTLDAYERDIRQFVEWLCPCVSNSDPHADDSCGSNSTSTFDAASVTTSDIRAWLGSLAQEGLSPSTLRRKTQSLRTFYHWAMKQGHLHSNPAADIVLAKKRNHLPNFVKESEMEQLLDVEPTTFKEQRTHICLTLLYTLGLRQAELLSLTDREINFSAREVRITGKRDKQRVMPLPDSLAVEIREWQKIRNKRYPDLEYPRPLIAGPHGPISKEQLYRIVRDGMAGLSTGRKSPHTLRHTFATSMINNGADLDAVREMLGHASLATTQIYTHLSFRELIDNYKGSHPRSKKS